MSGKRTNSADFRFAIPADTREHVSQSLQWGGDHVAVNGIPLSFRLCDEIMQRKFCMMRSMVALASALTAWLITGSLFAGDWPHWRGPNRNDIVAEVSGWSGKNWLPGRAAWKTSVGIGSSSPLVVANRLYVTGWESGKDVLRCLDAKTGRELWRQVARSPQYGRHSIGDKGIYAGPSSTPEFDSTTGYLYTLGIDGDLTCWNTKTNGKRVWGFNLYHQYGVKQRPNVGRSHRMHRDYGYTSSPLVHGASLIVEVGAKAGTLIAFDKRTGKTLWASQCRDEAGHTGGAVPITIERVPCVAILTLRQLVVMRSDAGHAGETIATYPWTTDYANNIATPAVSGDSVVITSAYWFVRDES